MTWSAPRRHCGAGLKKLFYFAFYAYLSAVNFLGKLYRLNEVLLPGSQNGFSGCSFMGGQLGCG